MGDVVGLGRARKARLRGQREVQAAANRVAFGRTGAQKKADRDAAVRRDHLLDGARIED
ncbi:MAG: DUF4169 family protein [Janthinobacterium lividum]